MQQTVPGSFLLQDTVCVLGKEGENMKNIGPVTTKSAE